jgi:L-asparaginase
VSKVPSRAVTPGDIWRLAGVVQEQLHSGADGVVVLHGTDTIEETAYGLSLLLEADVPVVLTGAMRPPANPGSDGPANVRAAITAAASGELAAYGPVVVFQDEVHAARWVTKEHTSRVAAFGSPASGPVGHLSEGRVRLVAGPPDPGLALPPVPEAPRQRVELVWCATGSDGLVVERIADALDGLVVAGTGGGHVAPPLAESLERVVAQGLPVVLASRCPSGPVLQETYEGPGSESALLAAGMLPVGNLSAVKARLRLLLGLAGGAKPTDLFPV